DVVDDRGSAVEADGGRKVRGLDAREAALALEALEQGCFLATDVGAGTWVDHEVDRPSGVEDVSADGAVLVRLVDGLRHPLEPEGELAAYEDERLSGTDRVGTDQRPLDDLVGVGDH